MSSNFIDMHLSKVPFFVLIITVQPSKGECIYIGTTLIGALSPGLFKSSVLHFKIPAVSQTIQIMNRMAIITIYGQLLVLQFLKKYTRGIYCSATLPWSIIRKVQLLLKSFLPMKRKIMVTTRYSTFLSTKFTFLLHYFMSKTVNHTFVKLQCLKHEWFTLLWQNLVPCEQLQ